MPFDLENLSLEELFHLHKRIVLRIQYLHSLKTRARLDQFEVGDRVSFQSDGRAVEGLVVRVNRKTVSVKTKDSHWTIHPKFLTRMPGAAGTPLTVEDLLGWLTFLAMNMAAEGLVDEGARLGLAWAGIRASEVFLGDRALILAEAGRETEAREQLAANVKIFPQHVWVQIKAGHAYEALKDFEAAEDCYRTARVLAHAVDRDEARHRAEESWGSREPVVRQGPKIGRNDPCPCASGKKFKTCCLGKESAGQPTFPASA